MTQRVPRGWTLVELLVALLLTAGLAVVGARVLELTGRMPGAGVTATQGAERMAPVLERLGQEARQALVASARVNGGADANLALEWVPVWASGRYRAEQAATEPPTGDRLDVADPADDRFDVLSPLTWPQGAAQLVIQNAGPAGGGVYAGSNRRLALGLVDGVLHFVPNGPWPAPDPQGAFVLVTGPVSWVCHPDPAGQGTLQRVQGYGWGAAQPVALESPPLAGGQVEVVLRGVVGCSWLISPGPEGRRWVTLDLEVQDQGVRTRMWRAWLVDVAA